MEQKRILIVEDSKTQAWMLQEDLKKYPYQVEIAFNGKQALKAVEKQSPDVIISDIEMPEMDGYEMCHQLKSLPIGKQIPVILLTSLSDPKEVIKAIECRADAFLTKPYNIQLLISQIEDSLLNKKEKKDPEVNEVYFRGEHYQLTEKQRPQEITELLLSTYLGAIQKNRELEEAHKNLTVINEQIKEKNKELGHLNTLKNQFLGIAAHDLRNPLGGIQGYAELLLDRLKQSQPQEYLFMLGRIKEMSAFMLNMVNELLDISVIESGQLRLDMKDVNLANLIEESLDLNKKLALRKNIGLVADLKDKNILIRGDSYRLEQVLNNLLSNAIKFSYPETTITIALKKQAEQAVIAVKDQGVGIPETEQALLFQSFSKTSAKSTGGEKSTGLGLAIVKKIIQEHQGKISVESQPNVGTTFYVALPLKN